MRIRSIVSLALVLALAGGMSVVADSRWVTYQAARLVVGQVSFTEQDPEPSRTVLGGAGGVAVAGNRLFVADGNRVGASPLNHRVLIYENLNSFVPSVDRPLAKGGNCPACVGVPDVVVGQPDFETFLPSSSTDIDAKFDTRNGMRNPTGVASDGQLLAVADTDNNRVLIWNSIPSKNGQRSSVVVGQPNHDEIAPNTTREGLRGPQGVWIDRGRLFIADTLNSRILIYNSIPTDDGQPADVVVGQPDFDTRHIPDFEHLDGMASRRNLFDPVSVTVKDNRMFITDLGHHRVLIYNSVPAVNYPQADVVVGQPDMEIGVENNSIDLCKEIPYRDDESEADDDDDDDGVPAPADGASTTVEDDEDPPPRFPNRCASTLSFPRFALSDGERLFIADGGNDRILGFNSIPDKNGAEADFVLGQPDFESNEQSDGAAHMRSPTALAHDGTNLYVADPFARRILVFAPGDDFIAADGVRNGASFSIHALGSITFTDPPETSDDEQEEDVDPVHQEVDIRLDSKDKNGDVVNWKYEFEFDEDLSAQQVRDIMLGRINADLDVQPDPATGEMPETPPAYALPIDGAGTYAQARVQFGGALVPGGHVSLRVGDSVYEHTILDVDQDPDTYILVDRFLYLINKRRDPLVVAERDFADDDLDTLLITARHPGSAGNSIPIAVSLSPDSSTSATLIEGEDEIGPEGFLKGGSIARGIRLVAVAEGEDGNAINFSVAKKGSGISAASSGTMLVGGHDARETPAGTMAVLFGQDLADAVYLAPAGAAELPKELGGVQVFANGLPCPLHSVSPEQVTFQMPFEITGSSASVSMRRTMPDGSVRASVPREARTTRAAPGLFAYAGSEPRQGVVLHGGGFAEGSIGLSLPSGGEEGEDGIEIDDRVNVTITIQDRTYVYRTEKTDTLEDIRDGIIAAVNAGHGDPDVAASGDTRGFFSARAEVTFSGEIAEGDEVFIHVRDRTYSYVVEEDDTLLSVRNILVEKINAGLGDPEVTARRLEEIGVVRMQIIARELGEGGNSIPFSVSTSRKAVIVVEVPEPEDEDERGLLTGGQTPPVVVLTARQSGEIGNEITYDAESEDAANLVATPTSDHLCCGTEAYSLVSESSPAVPGETIIVFGTGLGLTVPHPESIGLKSGQVTPSGTPLNVPFNSDDFVSSLAGAKTAQVVFAGLMPGGVGTYQINLKLNSDLPDDSQTPLTIAQGLFVSNTIVFPVRNLRPPAQ